MYVQSTSPICRQYKGDRSSSGCTCVYYRSVADDGTGSCLRTLEVDKKRTSTLKKVLADFQPQLPTLEHLPVYYLVDVN